jgi:hypothetical protein
MTDPGTGVKVHLGKRQAQLVYDHRQDLKNFVIARTNKTVYADKFRISRETRNKILSVARTSVSPLDSVTIGRIFDIRPQSVAAVAAHGKMGTYGKRVKNLFLKIEKIKKERGR